MGSAPLRRVRHSPRASRSENEQNPVLLQESNNSNSSSDTGRASRNCVETRNCSFADALSWALMPEALGAVNPIVAGVPLAGGRLQLQATCREAERCVRSLALAAHRRIERCGGFNVPLACARGEIEAVWAYLTAGAPLVQTEADEPFQEPSLVLYALAGRHDKLVALLLQSGYDLPELPKDPSKGYDALRAASHGDVSMVLRLIAAGLKINTGYTFNWTLLMSAACGRQLEMVEVLLACGARPGDTDTSGKTAADLATLHGHPDIAETIAMGGHSPLPFASPVMCDSPMPDS